MSDKCEKNKCPADKHHVTEDEWLEGSSIVSCYMTDKGYEKSKITGMTAGEFSATPVTINGRPFNWDDLRDLIHYSFVGGHYYGAHQALGINHTASLIGRLKEALGKLTDKLTSGEIKVQVSPDTPPPDRELMN